MGRIEIEARARAEALFRDELARRDSLLAELAELEPRAAAVRRCVAALAGSRLVGLLVGYGTTGRWGPLGSGVERRGAELRRRRFRLARRKRVLTRGHPQPAEVSRSPAWLADLDRDAIAQRGPQLRRHILAGLLGGGDDHAGRPARLFLDANCPIAAVEAVAELGLERASNLAEADGAIVADREGNLGFDWVLAGERSIASAKGLGERLDSGDASALGAALRASAQALTFCIRIAGRDWAAADRGGDAALARALARALGERGHQALLQVDAEAGDPLAECLDVLLVLRGRSAGEPTPGRVNLIWQISHPEETEAAELNRYDRVLVASRRYAEQLRGTIQPPVETLLQFTDPKVFHPLTAGEPTHDVAFVGNWRGEFRRIVWDALESGHAPALYGRGWDLLAPEHAVAEHVPHEELHRIYSSCRVLLCDHWDDMRRHGFVSNKVFDALACEAFVIADENPGLADELAGAVETYSSPAELGEKIDRSLGDAEGRERMARRGRTVVLAKHTVEQRVEQLLAIALATARECEREAVAHLRLPATDRRGEGSADGGSAAVEPRREAGAESA